MRLEIVEIKPTDFLKKGNQRIDIERSIYSVRLEAIEAKHFVDIFCIIAFCV